MWGIGDIVYSTSTNGRYAFSYTAIYDTTLKRQILDMPTDTAVSGYNSASEKLIVQVDDALEFYPITFPISIPAPVLSANNQTDSSIELSWTDKSLEIEFIVQQRELGSDNWVDIKITAANVSIWTATNLQEGLMYEFRVRASSIDNSSSWSNLVATDVDGDGIGDNIDIDNDNDMDVFLTGYNNSSEAISKLYTNDGSGNYTEVDIPLEGIYNSSIAFADVDDDNDLDVLMMGTDNSFTWHTTLYTNDGSGNYMEVIEAPFEDVSRSEIAFADIDGDNDIDALITGKNNSDQNITKLYSNDGNGIFTEVTDTPFEQIAYGSITFTDVDGDNDLDVLMTGRNNSNQNITKLYSNDGNGNFTEVTDTPFEGVESSAVAFADIDGDNDMDVLMTGSNNSNQNITKLYSNDGNGNFTQVADTPFEATSGGSVAFADIDGDNDMDVLIAGLNDSYQTTTNLYTNDGSGNFTEVADTPFENIYVGIVKFVDMDGDNDMDVFISGENNSFQSTSKAYTNDGGGNYTEIADTPFIGLLNSKAIFIDVDGDTDMDLILTGFNIGSTESYSKLYTNDGNGNYTEVTETSFVGLGQGDLAAADVDGDNDIDIMITGYNTTTESRISKLYFNHTAQAVFATDEQLACNTFTWIDDISYTEDNTTAQHTLIGEAANGGDSIVTLNLTINTVSDLSTSVDVATITANNENGTYQWLDCDNDYSIIEGATEMSFSPTVNGNYAVEIIENGNACIDTTSCVSITTVGLIENKINNAVVYPNPTDGAFNISLQSVLEEIHITVFNIVGRKVHAATYSNTNSIDLELNQPSGVYFVEIRTKEDSNTIQLIKK